MRLSLLCLNKNPGEISKLQNFLTLNYRDFYKYDVATKQVSYHDWVVLLPDRGKKPVPYNHHICNENKYYSIIFFLYIL